MENSKIGWTHHTWNPWMGCHKVSPACKFCYIETVIKRMGKIPFQGPMATTTSWENPSRWNRRAAQQGHRSRVFTCSLSDFFHEGADAWRDEAWAVIRECRNLDWMILTKRPELIANRLPADWGDGYPNVWLGVTVENRNYVHRLDTVLEIPAVLYWVSAEPLLGQLDLRPYFPRGLSWVITGCEQAHKDKRRRMDWNWVRDLEEQSREAGAAFFHKQYYVGNQIVTDGLLDGRVCQEWPLPKRPLNGLARHIGRYAADDHAIAIPAIAGHAGQMTVAS